MIGIVGESLGKNCSAVGMCNNRHILEVVVEKMVEHISEGPNRERLLEILEGQVEDSMKVYEKDAMVAMLVSKDKLEEAKAEDQILTGILYLKPDSEDFHDINQTTDTPLNQLTEKELCPGNEVLQAFNESLR